MNQLQAARVAVRLEQALGGSLDGRCLAVLGLTFKPGTDDLRESPSLAIIGDLVARGAHVRVHDPVALDHAHLPEGAEPAAGVRAAVAGADAVLVLTEWPEYVALSEADLAGMRGGLIYDGRNALDPARFPHMVYVGVGRSATALGQAEAAAAREKA